MTLTVPPAWMVSYKLSAVLDVSSRNVSIVGIYNGHVSVDQIPIEVVQTI